MLLILLALVVTSGAAGAAYYYLGGSQDATAKAAVKPPQDPIFVALEPFTVNLQPNGRNRFLHVAVTLKVSDTKSQSQLVQYMPEVRSRVLTTLSNRASDSLVTVEEKNLLATEILAVLNRPFAANLPSAAISSAMFTTFMLQ
ncbi:flagellar basal body-associated protein FliL [Polaromonas sp.]|uniref:flagellar basal body-associated protein FliL n=1 Tax=Polaromonas sp. TaxID=1869339 RepID=UPI00326337D3